MTTRRPPQRPPWFALCAISLCAAGCFEGSPIAGAAETETDGVSTDTADTDGPAATSGSGGGPSSGPGPGTSTVTTTGPGSSSDATTTTATTNVPPTTDSSIGTTGDGPDTDDSSSEEGSSSGDDTSSDSSGGDACEDTQTCVPGAPDDWEGPVLVYEGDAAPPSCPAAAPTSVLDAFADVTADPANCSCSCGDPAGLSCGAATLIERGNDCLSFVMNPQSFTIPPGVCVPISGTNDTAWFLDEGSLDVSSASCAPAATESVDPPQTSGQVRACLPAAAEPCDEEGVCLGSDEAFDRTCVFREGMHACPGGMFDQQQFIYTAVDDTRGCSSCSCGTPSGTCGGTFFSTSNSCTIVEDTLSAEACTVFDAVPFQGSYSPAAQASCTPTGGASTGDASGAGAYTLCCDG